MAEAKQQQDNLGFDNRTEDNRKRTINQDGSFNIVRKNEFVKEFQLYRWSITCPWSHYWLAVLSVYIVINFSFAGIYYMLGPEYIIGINPTREHPFWQCFFFSLQTYTTVGYGGLHPVGIVANSMAGFEAFLGLMTFALATGTLYGRFSKPTARIKYSPNAIVAPFKDHNALMFMICNDSSGNLVEVTAQVNLSWVERDDEGKPIRRFERLKLEYEKINMLALTWTIVHPIDETSKINHFTAADFAEKDVEIFILITVFDDSFSQTVHSRSSYLGKEIVYGAKFKRPFYVNDVGETVLDVHKVGDYDKVSLNQSSTGGKIS
ncbi:MAG: ion channel [Bacteroidota bacterium]